MQLRYQVDGQGGEPIVIVHGGPGLSMSYLPVRLMLLGHSRGASLVMEDPGAIELQFEIVAHS